MAETKLEGRLPFNMSNENSEKRFQDHWALFTQYLQTKEQKIRFFNKNGISRNILEYVNDSVDRMNEFHLKQDHKDDWQNNVFDPITRDKLIAILSRLVGARMKVDVLLKSSSIFNTDDIEFRKTVYNDLLENANIHNKEQEKLVWEMFTAMSEGTVIGFESWARDTREVEYVKEFNPDTGEKVVEKIKVDSWDDVFGEIVPIEEFFPETIWCNVSDFRRVVHRAFRVREMTYAGFVDKFGKFAGSKDVQVAGTYRNYQGFDWGISSDVNNENVQVIEFYDEVKDKMGIWANGTEIYYGCSPWNHKRLPFWLAINEPIHHQLLWGKSLPDKLQGMQDVDNGILNGMLDQLYIALNSPLFVAGSIDDLDDGYLDPKRIYTMSEGSTVQRGTLGSVDQTGFQMLQMVKRGMELTSTSDQSQGVATGGRKTKFEVQQLQEGALNLAGLFIQLMESAMEWKYSLRLPNILQYYSMPSRTKTGKKQFKFITLENRKLPNGKVGKRVIQIMDSASSIPSKEKMQEMTAGIEGKPHDVLEAEVQAVAISRDYLMNKEYELGISIVPNSSIKQSQAEKDNKNIAFYQITSQDPWFDQEMNKRDFAKAFGKDEKIVKKIDPNAAPNPAEMLDAKGLPGGAIGKGIPAPQVDMNQL